MAGEGWASDPNREANENPGEKSAYQVLLTHLVKGGSESLSKPMGILEAGEVRVSQ